MYTIRKDKPLNPVIHAVLASLRDIGKSFGTEHFIVGATARDVLMTHVFGVDAARATRDVDFAIAVKDWHQFNGIKSALIDMGDFEAAAGQAHRLYYRRQEFGLAYPLDLIPFGEIESPDKIIAWPPDMEVVMNVAGYAEALASAVQVNVGNGVGVQVVSIPALTALKILAWDERGLATNKDAEDFYFLTRHYHQADNEGRLYDEAYSLMEMANYDRELAGAALLGYDTRVILEPSTHNAVLAVLGDAKKRDRLVIHMNRSLGADPSHTQRFVTQFAYGLALARL
jgi:predicted nucleotidyltransferase